MSRPKSNAQGTFMIDGFKDGIGYGTLNANQFAELVNLWWKDGKLATRPGIKALPKTYRNFNGNALVNVTGGNRDIPTNDGICRRLAFIYKRNTGTGAVYDVEMSSIGYDGKENRSTIIAGAGESSFSSVMLVESGGGRWQGTAAGGAIAFIGQGGKGSGGRILAQPADFSSPWVDITEQAYIPLVMINAKGSPTLEQAQNGGIIYEGFNLLTPKFRARFTTNDEEGKFYFLPVKQLDNSEITVKYTDSTGTVYTYVIPENSNMSEVDSDGIAVCVDRVGGYVYCYQPSKGYIRWFPSSGISNNLEVIASKTRDEGMDKICSMRFCTWFGGDKNGIQGGPRLFVGGHRLFPNLIYWSDADNPLYFPENNFAYIGDAGQFVTAFAKQGEKLIIFKESEVYYATYTSGSRVSKYLLDGSVIDATSNEAGFPVSPIHPSVGCDCPETIQLCGNRLVWATSSGRVFALNPANQYSENSVIEISGAVQQQLKSIGSTALKSAVSADYCGHYILLAGNDAFLFNYNEAKFQHYGANLVPWVRWKFDLQAKPLFMMSNGFSLALCSKIDSGGFNGRITALLDEGCDEILYFLGGNLTVNEREIEFKARTGLYDFKYAERNKDVRALLLEINGDESSKVFASLFDESGTIGESRYVGFSENGMAKISTNAVRVRMFGFCLQGSGCVSIGRAILSYRLYGKAVR